MCFYQQALCVEIKCNDYFDVHIKIAIVIDLNCALFLLRINASRNRISRASFPCGIWLQAWGAVRIYIENDELRGSLSVSFVAEAGGTAKPPRIQAAVVIDAAIL